MCGSTTPRYPDFDAKTLADRAPFESPLHLYGGVCHAAVFPLELIVAAVIGIYIIVELPGAAGARVREIQEKFDPKLARLNPPHLTLAGSSGVGAIPAETTIAALRAALEPIAATTAPMALPLGAPIRFMQTEIVSLPMDQHGPLRALHERIARSGLKFKPARFSFTPHVTMSFFPTLTPASERELLSLRVNDPAIVDRIQVYLTRDPQPSRKLLELQLTGKP